MTKGGRNLLIMGAISVVIAFATTSVSLAIYHNSGDIYLDRSRPGFLPDKDEIEDDGKENDENYVLDKDTKVTTEVLDEYLEALEKEIENLDAYENPYSESGLSDARLGI